MVEEETGEIAAPHRGAGQRKPNVFPAAATAKKRCEPKKRSAEGENWEYAKFQ